MITRGSQWHRWDPHIHSPGTVLNDQFGGNDRWSRYLAAIEAKTPKIRALAITDYYLTDNYRKLTEYKAAGRLSDVELILPNVEMRLDVAAKSGFVNRHLLVSPEDSNHLAELARILSRIKFRAFDDRFDCTREELIPLGRRANPKLTTDGPALREGAKQFKVNFSELRDVYRDSAWAKENILIAVATNAGDGTSGVRDASDAVIRQEIEAFARIMFANGPAQREFWLGQKDVSETDLRARYGGLKPCLHGSDSHAQSTVGEVTDDRFCWIKGGLEFDALRQACIDPAGRAYVGSEPPATALPSQVISSVTIENADWFDTPEIPLNPGLVAIIGARGSGKTALADIIAVGCDAVPATVWRDDDMISSSFLNRAKPHLGNAVVQLRWGGGDEVHRALDGSDADDIFSFPRARYLSQQFVEELCSSHGSSDRLIAEIERVIFDAHPIDSREGAYNFEQLRDRRTDRFRQAQAREADAIMQISRRISEEMEKERLVAALAQQGGQKAKILEGYRADLAKLVIKGSDAHLRRYQQLEAAAQALRARIETFKKQWRSFQNLADEVASTRKTLAPEMLREAKSRYPNSGLNTAQWQEFLLDYKGPVDNNLAAYTAWAAKQIEELEGKPPQTSELSPYIAAIAADADLSTIKLAVLVAEMARIQGLLNADKLVHDQYTTLSSRIAQEDAALKDLQKKVEDAQGAADRRRELQVERAAAYERVFDAIISEQKEVRALYAPLRQRLQSAGGTLQKLRFTVMRTANAAQWADDAEENLLDRRQSGSLRGRGSLVAKAVSELKPVWETGTAAEARAAITTFIAEYHDELLGHAPVPREKQEAFRDWLRKFTTWLFSTEHVNVRYGITYDGLDIAKLSPGTRGIVLLLLYLALDDADDRRGLSRCPR